MGLEIFLFVCNLLIPMIMLFFGMIFRKHGPKNINVIYGYRTTRSMKNKETWEFAHQYCGKLWTKLGFLMFILSLVVSIAALTLNDNVQGIICGLLVSIQTVALIASIFPVEKALKANFDEKGNRSNKRQTR